MTRATTAAVPIMSGDVGSISSLAWVARAATWAPPLDRVAWGANSGVAPGAGANWDTIRENRPSDGAAPDGCTLRSCPVRSSPDPSSAVRLGSSEAVPETSKPVTTDPFERLSRSRLDPSGGRSALRIVTDRRRGRTGRDVGWTGSGSARSVSALTGSACPSMVSGSRMPDGCDAASGKVREGAVPSSAFKIKSGDCSGRIGRNTLCSMTLAV